MVDMSKIEGGGAGCVVVFAAFFIQVIGFGTSQSVGVYNIEFLRAFDAGAAAVSLVGSINLGVFLGAGPVASLLMSKWSHRQVALAGAGLSSLGLICMPFAPNLPYMYVFYGVVSGLGNCLTYLPSHVLSGLYFNKHRSLATGIATAGSGLGATIFPIVLYHLIEYYGWRGSLFIVAGLNLHLLVFAGLLFPVPEGLLKSFKEENKNDNENLKLKDSALANDTFHEYNSIVEKDTNKESIPLYEIKQNHKNNEKEGILIDDIQDDKSLELGAQAELLKTSRKKPILERKESVSQRLGKHFCAIFSFAFIVYFFSNIFWNAGGAVVLIFLPEYMTSIGLSKETASSVFTLVGAGSCVGCVLGGLLGNIKHINRISLYSLGCMGAGALTLLYPWQLLHSPLGQGLLSASFGLMFGIILGLLVVVTADLLGTEALGDGFGYLMFANGIGVFGGPPLAGIVIDNVGSLDPGMYLSGVLTMTGGVVMCLIPVYKKLTSRTDLQGARVIETEIESSKG